LPPGKGFSFDDINDWLEQERFAQSVGADAHIGPPTIAQVNRATCNTKQSFPAKSKKK
jgi:hypothetical protein